MLLGISHGIPEHSATIGLGHIVRCYAISQILQAAGHKVVWCSDINDDANRSFKSNRRQLSEAQGELFVAPGEALNEIRFGEWARTLLWIIVDDYSTHGSTLVAFDTATWI